MKPPEDEIGPDLAESWEYSPDGLQITLKLRQGVKFHNKPPVNGRALDMDDVLFSWNRFAREVHGRASVANSADPSAPVLSFTAPDSENDRHQAEGAARLRVKPVRHRGRQRRNHYSEGNRYHPRPPRRHGRHRPLVSRELHAVRRVHLEAQSRFLRQGLGPSRPDRHADRFRIRSGARPAQSR